LKLAGSGGGFLNVGLSPAVDLRVGLRLQYGAFPILAFPVTFRFNLGSVYSIALGANIGYRWAKGNFNDGYATTVASEKGLSLGPEVSFLNFRFGRKREFEAAAVQGLAWPMTTTLIGTDHGAVVFYNTFVFSMLF
jgi:hypothetical protein